MPPITSIEELENQIDDDLEIVDTSLREYDITASPNDFNVKTINDFIESGAVSIPGFQRNYVWDLPRASKLIESIIIGLPIPQIFLYEQARNSFMVIDGQQRLMSLYYFIKGRFPRKEIRSKLREVFLEHGKIPDEVFQDDSYFQKFNLRLPVPEAGGENHLNGLSYATLGDLQTTFELRTIRNVIIKQTRPEDDDSSIYEIFNRLNSGGINLKPQEIRMALYHSDFYRMLAKLNHDPRWRTLLGVDAPDLHMKDMEILVRGYAMLLDSENYKPSLVRFINRFSRRAKEFSDERVNFLEIVGEKFLAISETLPEKMFFNRKTNRFSVPMFESAFVAACTSAIQEQDPSLVEISESKIELLHQDKEFIEATQLHTTGTTKVETRLRRAKELFASEV
ncbi:MAG: DUF262 domain-containing protein [Planctomycetes bacterium]|nr:DUF262 domain-containing protein [Planctomycetota bacterium]